MVSLGKPLLLRQTVGVRVVIINMIVGNVEGEFGDIFRGNSWTNEMHFGRSLWPKIDSHYSYRTHLRCVQFPGRKAFRFQEGEAEVVELFSGCSFFFLPPSSTFWLQEGRETRAHFQISHSAVLFCFSPYLHSAMWYVCLPSLPSHFTHIFSLYCHSIGLCRAEPPVQFVTIDRWIDGSRIRCGKSL